MWQQAANQVLGPGDMAPVCGPAGTAADGARLGVVAEAERGWIRERRVVEPLVKAVTL